MTVESSMEPVGHGDRHPSSDQAQETTCTWSFRSSANISVDEQTWGLTGSCAVPSTEAVFTSSPSTKTRGEFEEEVRRCLPRSLSIPSLDSASELWDGWRDCYDRHHIALSSTEEGDGADDGCIPYDYESEMEECSQYTFSDAPYSPSTTAALAAAASPPMDARTSFSTRPGTPRAPSVLTLPGSVAWSREREPLSQEWVARQRRDNDSHHTGEHLAWHRGMKEASSAVPSQMRYALRSLVREAGCREIRSLRSRPAASFMQMEVPQSDHRTCSSMRASCMLASATSMKQRKDRFIHIIAQRWKALEERLEEMLEGPAEGGLSMELHLRAVGNALNSLFLFSSDSQHIIREMNMNHVEEQRRQRRDREAQLITTLESQGRLFVLPSLYAVEVEEPEPVLQIESVLCPNESINLYTHPWQLLSPDLSLYSPSLSPTPDESIGATSPCSSGGMSATCSPMLSSQSSSHSSTRLTVGCSNVWKEMRPTRLPLLDIFLAAPTVVSSKAGVDNELGMSYVMPVDLAYGSHKVCSQEALTRSTLGGQIFSPQLCDAIVRGEGKPACTSDDCLLSNSPGREEESWRLHLEENPHECTEIIKHANAEMFLLSIEMDEAGTSPGFETRRRMTLMDD